MGAYRCAGGLECRSAHWCAGGLLPLTSSQRWPGCDAGVVGRQWNAQQLPQKWMALPMLTLSGVCPHISQGCWALPAGMASGIHEAMPAAMAMHPLRHCPMQWTTRAYCAPASDSPAPPLWLRQSGPQQPQPRLQPGPAASACLAGQRPGHPTWRPRCIGVKACAHAGRGNDLIHARQAALLLGALHTFGYYGSMARDASMHLDTHMHSRTRAHIHRAFKHRAFMHLHTYTQPKHAPTFPYTMHTIKDMSCD